MEKILFPLVLLVVLGLLFVAAGVGDPFDRLTAGPPAAAAYTYAPAHAAPDVGSTIFGSILVGIVVVIVFVVVIFVLCGRAEMWLGFGG